MNTNDQPGHELNILVAEKVFGYKVYRGVIGRNTERQDGKLIYLDDYSTTWEGMRLVVEEIERRSFEWAIQGKRATVWNDDEGIDEDVKGESSPHAL
ncbi:hypothetical protein, partial [Cohnella sp. AR92]